MVGGPPCSDYARAWSPEVEPGGGDGRSRRDHVLVADGYGPDDSTKGIGRRITSLQFSLVWDACNHDRRVTCITLICNFRKRLVQFGRGCVPVLTETQNLCSHPCCIIQRPTQA